MRKNFSMIIILLCLAVSLNSCGFKNETVLRDEENTVQNEQERPFEGKQEQDTEIKEHDENTTQEEETQVVMTPEIDVFSGPTRNSGIKTPSGNNGGSRTGTIVNTVVESEPEIEAELEKDLEETNEPEHETKEQEENVPVTEEESNPEDETKPEEKPEDTKKTVEVIRPGISYRPSGGRRPTSPKPVEPEEPHVHTWGDWRFKDDEADERECSGCGAKETQPHTLECTTVEYEDCMDETHIVKSTYSCSVCNSSVYQESSTEAHEYGEWKYSEDGMETTYCVDCKHAQTREHQHDAEPEDLEYAISSNNNGTHKIEASYTCSGCTQLIAVSKEEDCAYDVTYEETGVNDTHIVIKNCSVCGHHTEEEGTCEPVGDLKLIKVYAQIYEYYDCGLCGDWCQRKYHTVHQFQPWEPHGNDEHIRYCICVEGRETAEHVFEYVQTDTSCVFTCTDCGYSKTTAKHNHGLDTHDEMDLMELVMSPAYYELVDFSQISNPNPSPTDYCSRYDFRCSTCGVKYHIYYAHDFKNGACTRGYCGHIAESELVSVNLEVEELIPEEFIQDIVEPDTSKIEEPIGTDVSQDIPEVEQNEDKLPSEEDIDKEGTEQGNDGEEIPPEIEDVQENIKTDTEDEKEPSESEPTEGMPGTDNGEQEEIPESESVQQVPETENDEEKDTSETESIKEIPETESVDKEETSETEHTKEETDSEDNEDDNHQQQEDLK